MGLQIWKSAECRKFCPHGVGMHRFPTHGYFQHPGSSLNPIVQAIFIEALSHSHSQLLTHLQPFHSPGEMRSVLEVQASSHGVVLGNQPILKPSWSPPRVTSLEQKTFLSPRNFQVIQELCAGSTYRPHQSGKYFRGSAEELQAETKYCDQYHKLVST